MKIRKIKLPICYEIFNTPIFCDKNESKLSIIKKLKNYIQPQEVEELSSIFIIDYPYPEAHYFRSYDNNDKKAGCTYTHRGRETQWSGPHSIGVSNIFNDITFSFVFFHELAHHIQYLKNKTVYNDDIKSELDAWKFSLLRCQEVFKYTSIIVEFNGPIVDAAKEIGISCNCRKEESSVINLEKEKYFALQY